MTTRSDVSPPAGEHAWGGDDWCWACRVLDGTSPGAIVTQTDGVAVLINPLPLQAGHALIVPRQHVRDLYALPDVLAGPILAMAARLARALKRTVGAEGVTLRQNNEAASDQHLFHFHLHVIPRFAGDGGRFNAAPQLIGIVEQEAMAVQLRAALAETAAAR